MYSNLEDKNKNDDDKILTFRVVLTGDTGVGKTSLLSKYVKGVFPTNPTNTIALEFCATVLTLKDGAKVRVQLFDTAGQEKYRSVVANFYRKALGALLVFDITRRETFSALQRFISDVKQYAEPDCVLFLIGNKLDLVIGNDSARQVSYDEAKSFANENQMYYMETSAFSGIKVTEAFENCIEKVYNEKMKTVTYTQKIENIDLSKRKTTLNDKNNTSCCS